MPSRPLREFGFRQPIVVDADGVIIVRPHALEGGAEARPRKSPGPRRHRSDAGADQGLSDRRQPDEHAGRVGFRPAADRTARPAESRTSTCRCLGFDQDEFGQAAQAAICNEGLCDPDEVPGAAGRGDDATRRSLDSWRPSLALRRQQQARGRGSPARRRDDPSRQYRPAVQREGRAAFATTPSPRANSTFADPNKHHQTLDLAAIPRSRSRRRRSCGPKIGRWPTTSYRRGVRSVAWPLGSATWPACSTPGRGFYIWGGYANLGNYPPVLKETRTVLLARRSSGTSSIRC